jgi:hypothetical protein
MEPYFALQLIGLGGDIRAGVWNTLSLNVTNTGKVVAKNVPVYILLDSHFDVDSSKWDIIEPLPGLKDSISLVTPIDTIIGTQHLQLKLYAMLVPVIGPEETKSIPFRIRTTQLGKTRIQYWADRRMYGSPFKAFWNPCFEEKFNFVAGFIPVVGCLNSIWDWGIGAGLAISPYSEKRTTLGAFTTNTFGTILSCAGGPVGSIGKKSFSMAAEFATISSGGDALKLYLGDKLAGSIIYTNNVSGDDGACTPKKQKEWENQDFFARGGLDPNQITGNNQYDSIRHYINNYSSQKYKISFENLPSATANAQHVIVTDTLNAAHFVFKSFSMNGIIIGDSMYMLPPYRLTLTKDVKIKNNNNMNVRFAASFDTATGILRADYFSIDTLGHVIPPDSLAGFLPPNVDGISGTGSLQFEIAAKNRNTLDTFYNKGTIYFDNNAPISTNTWINTIDTTAPQAAIISATIINDTTARLIIQKSDIGSGVRYNQLFIKKITDTVFINKGPVFGDTVLLNGQHNQTYQLFVKAADNVGNKQRKDSVADITITFSTNLPLSWLSFTGRLINDRVQLNWTTANEMNTSHFDIEKSTDGGHYAKIGMVTARGATGQNNDYTFRDEHPVTGNNYYRLKQIDIDGRNNYSTVVKIYYGQNGYLILAPNPAKDYVEIKSTLHLSLIQIIDAAGKAIRSFAPSADNRYSLAGISRGIYFIRLVADAEVQTHKLMIE